MNDNNEEHKIRCVGGRYKCTNDSCNFDTLNRWVAENHVIEQNGLDSDDVETDAPDWFVE